MNVIEQRKVISNIAKKCWDVATELRGSMDANEYKNYFLGIIFYKFLSDKVEKFFTSELKSENLSYEEAWTLDEYHDVLIDESLKKLGYFIEPSYLFKNLLKMYHAGSFSVDFFDEAIRSVVNYTKGTESEETFNGLFDAMDLMSSHLGKTVAEQSEKIGKTMVAIDSCEIDFDTTDVDILGASYEELIGKFASDAGQKAGEFYTPTNMSKLVSRLATLGLTDIKAVFDPTCGSGSLLLQVGNYANVRNYYGQENSYTTYNLARQNMLLHGIKCSDFKIVNCNTLTEDVVFKDMQYTVQVANPPYSLVYDPKSINKADPRFVHYGDLPQKKYAEWLFVEHMIHHMDDDGRIVVLLPHGVLFRSGAEAMIRKFMVANQNYLDAVIGLPENCFHGTNISVACLVFRKNREGNENNICFIDASKYFIKVGNKNTITDQDIDRIINAYTERKDIDKFCHIATMDEIENNDYNLNISRYVDNFEDEKIVDIAKAKEELAEIGLRKQTALDKVNTTMRMLGL